MIVERAFLELYPQSKLREYSFALTYSGKFNAYNGNVKQRGRHISFALSSLWKGIDESIQIGLIQILFNKLFRTKNHTSSMDLYEIFLKKIHIAVPKTKNDPILEASFQRVNEAYFHGMMEQPNLAWGTNSMRLLGKYEYGSDTITMSTIFKGEDTSLLDFIMYHETLHKKHKFSTKNGRSFHHTPAFLADEKRFAGYNAVQKTIEVLVRRKKRFFFHF